jgi:uncharacterized protein (DUF697 family)
LRILFHDGSVKEWFVALEPFPFSSATAISLAAMIHRIAEHFGGDD